MASKQLASREKQYIFTDNQFRMEGRSNLFSKCQTVGKQKNDSYEKLSYSKRPNSFSHRTIGRLF